LPQCHGVHNKIEVFDLLPPSTGVHMRLTPP